MSERRLLHLARSAAPPDAAVEPDDTVVVVDRETARFRVDGRDVDSDAVIALLLACDAAVVW